MATVGQNRWNGASTTSTQAQEDALIETKKAFMYGQEVEVRVYAPRKGYASPNTGRFVYSMPRRGGVPVL